MKVILIGAVPLALLATVVVWKALRGRPIRRHALNVIVAVCLLLYFAVTAGLGIFWVANQELPVFDIHYLFGYLTLLLVGVHVAINRKALTSFARQRAPGAMLTPDRRAWRASLGAILAFGALCYWIGLGQGSTTVEVRQGREVAAATHADGARPKPRGVRQQMVTEGGREQGLADYYHQRTRHTRQGVLEKGGRIEWSQRPVPYKGVESKPSVMLPKDWVDVSMPTGKAIEVGRRTVQALSPETVTLRQLSTLLHMTNGITAVKETPRGSFELRAAPSAGALYPTLTYVLATHVEGLAPGLYHYDVKRHALRLVRKGDGVAARLEAASAHGPLIRQASFVLVFSTEYFRTSWKYQERSWRYSLMDAGHLAVQAMLGATGLGLSAKAIGRFDDAKVNALLGLEPAQEAALLIVPVGGEGVPTTRQDEPVFTGRPADIRNPRVPRLITLTHGRTSLAIEGTGRVQSFEMPEPLRHPRGQRVVGLPGDVAEGDALGPSIQRRRSIRRWSTEAMPKRHLSSLLYHAFGMEDGSMPDPSIEDGHDLRLYVVVHHVKGIEPGLYAYLREEHALSLIKAGELRGTSHAMSLFQEVVRDASAVLIKTIDARAMTYPDGARGYRYAAMDAGMVGGRVYLQSTALGLGCTGIGAFFDDEVSELIGRSPDVEHIIYLSAVGVPAGP